jgi:hypothetical protein
VEDLVWQNKRVVKIWFLCNVIGGELTRTQGAIEEGLIEARWFRKDQLKNEIVFPAVIIRYNWGSFIEDNWKTQFCLRPLMRVSKTLPITNSRITVFFKHIPPT